jgi:ribosomal protein S18 acetylase RimI-like enzyme
VRESDYYERMILRIATAADEPILSRLAARLAGFELPSWRAAEEIISADARGLLEAVREGSTDNQVLIAERESVPVGCLHILAQTDFFGRRHAHISVVATSEAAEGSGVGRALMARAEAWARERGLSLVTLNVFAANARARRFYERAGYTQEIVKYAKPL